MANEQNLKPFVKGDKRINRKGRPKSFDALRTLAQQIAHEEAIGKDKAPLGVTVVEAIMRQWAMSGNPQLQKLFVEVAFGKVPDKVELDNADDKPFEIRIVDVKND